jgi:hypothetical protein
MRGGSDSHPEVSGMLVLSVKGQKEKFTARNADL